MVGDIGEILKIVIENVCDTCMMSIDYKGFDGKLQIKFHILSANAKITATF